MHIELFRERFEWITQNFPTRDGTWLFTKTDLFNRIANLKKDGDLPGSATISRVHFDRFFKDDCKNVNDALLKSVSYIYPDVPWKVLACPAISEFRERGVALLHQREIWIEATTAVARDRAGLSWAAKKYYKDVDAAADDFPLVTGEGWLLDAPLKLTEGCEHPVWNGTVKDVPGSPLLDNGYEYLDIKRKFVIGTKFRPNNGPTFRVTNFYMKDGLPNFTFGRGRYFSYINTCEVLAAEFAMNPEKLTPASHPRRGEPSSIFDFSWRSAFPGVNCLLVVKNFQGHLDRPVTHMFALHKRGQTTAEAQNTVHVVPAGGHQPLGPDWGAHNNDPEMRIWRTAVREFIEELFNKDEAQKMKNSSLGFFDEPGVKDIYSRFFTKNCGASVYYLGMGFDPLTTKPEILVAIVIDWKVVSDANYRLNDKWFYQHIEENYEGSVYFCDFNRDRLMEEARRGRVERSILPAGAACLIQVAREGFFDSILNID